MTEALGPSTGPALCLPPPPLPQVLERFEVYLRAERRLSPCTVNGYQEDVRLCVAHVAAALGRPPELADLTRDRLQAFLASLEDRSERTVQRRAAGLRSLFTFAAGVLRVCEDVARYLVLPKMPPRKLPRVLSEEECARLVEAPITLSGRSVPTVADLRDSALLELLYAAGLRVSEAAGVRLDDLILRPTYAVLLIRGKGKRERLVAVQGLALQALRRYLGRRGEIAGAADCGALFLSWWGQPLSRRGVHRVVQRWTEAAGVRAWPHLLRHCCATHLQQRGANLRQLQEFLGHADPAITARYAQVAEGQLIEVASLHPRSAVLASALTPPEEEGEPTAVGLIERVMVAVRAAADVLHYARRLFGRAAAAPVRVEVLDPAPSPG